ncbi:MAG TPA: class I SAM-dependent methyltransferase [Stellaceae bacterium]|nr:class I SAM-dependent methyltransferase [Stellaceae bacterium]
MNPAVAADGVGTRHPDQSHSPRGGTTTACPICGFERPLYEFAARHVTVGKCGSERCGHLYAIGAGKDAGIQSHEWLTEEAPKFAERNERLVRFWQARRFLTPETDVLDIGSGGGHIAAAARRAARSVTCLEPDAGANEALAARGFPVAGSLDEMKGRRFGAILLTEVIEHVEDPVSMLRTCADLLAPGGRIFLTTPCGELASGSHGTHAYDTKEHVQFFTEHSLQVACTLAGLPSVSFLNPGVMAPSGEGVERIKSAVKAVARPVRDLLFGRHHLVAFVGRGDEA